MFTLLELLAPELLLGVVAEPAFVLDQLELDGALFMLLLLVPVPVL